MFGHAFLLLLLVCLPAFAPGASPPPSPPAARLETMKSGPVELTFSFEPPDVRLDRDVIFSMKASSPTHITIQWPALDNRLGGFQLTGSYDIEPVLSEGRVIRERRVKLSPQLAEEYRIAPMVLWYRDTSASPPRDNWLVTRPLVLAVSPVAPAPGTGGKTIEDIVGPRWIPPSWPAIALTVLGILLTAALLWLLGKWIGHIRRRLALRRLSPRERALRELGELLGGELLTLGRIKDFYCELTMIVRRYIERAHAVKAPEQTTEEFLETATRDPRFNPDAIRRLKAFLQAADLVKYAAFRPPPSVVDQASQTARTYIESDAVETVMENNPNPAIGGTSPKPVTRSA